MTDARVRDIEVIPDPGECQACKARAIRCQWSYCLTCCVNLHKDWEYMHKHPMTVRAMNLLNPAAIDPSSVQASPTPTYTAYAAYAPPPHVDGRLIERTEPWPIQGLVAVFTQRQAAWSNYEGWGM